MQNRINIILTGATGMVGEGVLLVSLEHPAVEQVLVINRKPCGVTHPKLREIIHQDFYDLSPIEKELSGYHACFFCLGISSVGVGAGDYYKVTHTLTMHVANTLSRLNHDLTFCYVSGAGTGEKGWQQWAKVKAATEKDLTRLPFRAAYGLRPGFIKPVAGQQHVHPFYTYIKWLYPFGRRWFPGGFCTMQELALCMIHLAVHGFAQPIIEGKDIIALAKER